MKHKLRSYIRAPKDTVLLSCDLSQAESWVVAYLANDMNMKLALQNGVLHETTAWGIFNLPYGSPVTYEQRYVGKQTNHSTAYRITPETAAETYNLNSPDGSVISVAQSRKNQQVWFGLYTQIKPWWADIDFTLKTNYNTLTTPYNFSYTFYGPENNEMKKAATAFIPQSTVADHFNGEIQKNNEHPGGLVEFMDQIPKEVRVINNSHDSFIAICPKPIAMDMYYLAKKLFYRPIMINGEPCWIPVDGEIGERWGELEKIKEAA
jgi:hypothetical protein